MKTIKNFTITFIVIIIVTITSCKKDGLKYVGTWEGTTDGNNPIGFVVSDYGDKGLITQFSFTGGCSSQYASVQYNNLTVNLGQGEKIEDKHFSFTIGEGTGSELYVSGNFKRKTLSGTYHISGYCESSGSYTATIRE